MTSTPPDGDPEEVDAWRTRSKARLLSGEQPLFPPLPFMTPATLELCRNVDLTAGYGACFICSYPKSGTTWTQNIVFQVGTAMVSEGRAPLPNERAISSGNRDGNTLCPTPQVLTKGACADFDHISPFAPFFEHQRTWDFAGRRVKEEYRECAAKIKRQMFNTHLWWDMLPKPDNARYIYVTRAGADACASFYHHLTAQVRVTYTPLRRATHSARPCSPSHIAAHHYRPLHAIMLFHIIALSYSIATSIPLDKHPCTQLVPLSCSPLHRHRCTRIVTPASLHLHCCTRTVAHGSLHTPLCTQHAHTPGHAMMELIGLTACLP